MFNLGFTELILLGAIALIFIGPKQLPSVARTAGRFMNELKRAKEDITGTFTGSKDFIPSLLEEEKKDSLGKGNSAITKVSIGQEQAGTESEVKPKGGHGKSEPH